MQAGVTSLYSTDEPTEISILNSHDALIPDELASFVKGGQRPD